MDLGKCCICGKEIEIKHPERKTPKDKRTCSRICYYARLKKYGHWNRGKTWDEMYSPEVIEKQEMRVRAKGKDHFNAGRKRFDLLIRNITDNPMMSKEKKKKIAQELKKAPIKTLTRLMDNMQQDKKTAYQDKAYEKYGRKCSICGEITGQIDVHHIDGNHSNNELSNLRILCAKHHREEHLRINKNNYGR